MELKVYNLDDRLELAKILVKNGYTVSQKKRKATPTARTIEYYLEVEENDENAASR